MADVSTVARFLNVSVDNLVGIAAARGLSVFPDTHLTVEQLVETFGLLPADTPAVGEGHPRPFVIARWVGLFLLFAGAAFVVGYAFLFPLPEWLRPKPSAMFFTVLSYAFWGLFTGGWGHLMLYRALKRRLLRGIASGLVLDCKTEGRQIGDHRAYFVRVSVLYCADGKNFAGETVGFGKTVHSFDIPPSRDTVAAAARFPEGSTLSIYFDTQSPERFALKRQLAVKAIALTTGAAVNGVSGFFFMLAGGVARTLSA